MDIKSFFIDYDVLFEVLVMIVIFAFFVERALSVVYESRWFIGLYDGKEEKKGIKEVIAIIVSIAVCIYWKVDAFSVISSSHANMTIPGYILTGMVVAGGSKGSIKLFRDIMGFKSTAEEERKKVQKARNEKEIKKITGKK